MQNKILLEAYIPLQISKKHILGRHEAVTECRKGALSLDIIIHSWAAIGQRPNMANMSYGDETKDILESNVSLKVNAYVLKATLFLLWFWLKFELITSANMKLFKM